ncbi:hypothetical protein MUO74_06835 [Candidatus Bathyarchaeota archaeon]|nr:hypothetical protein [Candidatus Bathyarchaeota archaeon]
MLQKLGSKAITKEELLQKAEQDFSLLPALLKGTSSSKATIRYACAKVLMDLSEEYPEKLYPRIDDFIVLLGSKYRILTWNAMAIIANLTRVDRDRKFDAIFEQYYGFLNNEYMVTVTNVVGNSAKIALAKPHLVQRIVAELLKVENIQLTPHLTAECKRVIVEHTIKFFDVFFEKIEAKEQVLSFAKKQLHSTRESLRKEAQSFLEKRDKEKSLLNFTETM